MDQQHTPTASPCHSRNLLVYIIGCPGSGEGTLCKLLAQDYDCYHVSIGDLLRSLKDERAQSYVDLAAHVEAGSLVPTSTIVKILEQAMTKKSPSSSAILIDGFPRRLDQGIAAEEQFGKPDLVVSFECEESIAMGRYLTRKLEGRIDDDEAMFHHRYNEFQRLNPAIAEYYRASGVLIAVCPTSVPVNKLPTALQDQHKRQDDHQLPEAYYCSGIAREVDERRESIGLIRYYRLSFQRSTIFFQNLRAG